MKLKQILLAGIAAGAANMAMAALETIEFKGEIVSSTCSVTVVGATGGVVTLPTVSASKLLVKDETAGATPFTLQVAGCTATGATQIKPSFFANKVDGKDLANISALATPATNVAIRIMEDDVDNLGSSGNSALDFTNGYATTSTFKNIPVAPATLEFPFVAQYIAVDDVVTSGTVQAIVEYELAYN
jgi:major type 1 subunit fimbrin (pilin)